MKFILALLAFVGVMVCSNAAVIEKEFIEEKIKTEVDYLGLQMLVSEINGLADERRAAEREFGGKIRSYGE